MNGTAWTPIAPVPGPARFGASAQVVRGKVYLIGGRSLGADGVERTVGMVDVYDPTSDAWTSAASMPTPVADAASSVWRDSLVYVIAGRGDTGAVSDVQIFDPGTNRWARANSVIGGAVYGHSGAIARDAIVYLDGARGGAGSEIPGTLEAAAWRGEIDPNNPTVIGWTRLPEHPGAPLFGGAAGVVGTRVLFLGGSDQAHDRAGLGAGGRPASPMALGLSYDVASSGWRYLRVPPTPTMDHRALLRAGGYLLIVGGMEQGATPSTRVRRVSVLNLLAGP
jgi:N-acetylneuraminic acid mutarotase